MNFKKMFLAVALCFVLLLPTLSFPFDRYPGRFKEFPMAEENQEYQDFIDVSTSFTKCTVLGTAEGYYADFESGDTIVSHKGVGVFGQEGSAFYIGHGYWITNTHVVEPELIKIELTKNISVMTFPTKILSKIITIGQCTSLGSVPAEVVYVDEERDICILKVAGNWPAFVDPGYKPEWTRGPFGDELYPGMAIGTIVAIRDDSGDKTPWFEVRYGTIVSTGVKLPGTIGSDALPWFSLNDVTTDLVIYPGDSGSPVFAWIDGQPVVIGVARAAAGYIDPWTGMTYYYSYFTRIDIVIPFVIEK